ncbi:MULTISPECIES: hypothetical protein [unclassified Streptomyces]|uniref:hypothetical protein n=1 Tax=unclassified Streptomyces TaxID=2593676 RepID=UPI00093E87BF|nr:hypothetical protein [Streptomyces sp. CB01580]
MSSLLRNRLTKRALRPALNLLDHRIQVQVDRASGQLRREIASLRAESDEGRRLQYALGLLLDGTGRGSRRIPPAHEMNQLVREIADLCGDETHAERGAVVAFRTLVALEACSPVPGLDARDDQPQPVLEALVAVPVTRC